VWSLGIIVFSYDRGDRDAKLLAVEDGELLLRIVETRCILVAFYCDESKCDVRLARAPVVIGLNA
jgi:hypothetical protein